MEVLLMMGLPGAGKTTWVKNNYPTAKVCSADHFFEKDGEYKWDVKRSGEAHAACMQKFIEVCRIHLLAGQLAADENTPEHLRLPEALVVDNTNLNVHSMAPYIAIACAYGIFPRIIFVRAPADAFERQVHKVPEFNWQAMRHQLNELLAHWPGIWPQLELVQS